MAAYRPLGTFPQYFLADGTVNDGGLINFYETDLTTRKDTFSDQGLTIPNANPVVLDSSGRPTTDIWGSDAYGVVITDSLGANPRTFNNIQPDVGTGQTIPALVNGDFLTNDGSSLLWDTVLQVPDPTGEAGKTIATDGSLVFWQTPATDVPISGDSGSIVVGTTRIIWGNGTFPASGTNSASIVMTFSPAFSGTPYFIGVTANGQNPTAIEGILATAAINPTMNGFTAYADTGFAAIPNSHTIINAIAFQWSAIGPV
jgi:hypothetical protein